jgi:hypothetical protein
MVAGLYCIFAIVSLPFPACLFSFPFPALLRATYYSSSSQSQAPAFQPALEPPDQGHSIRRRQRNVRQRNEGRGSKVVDRLALDLHSEFPDMKGLSRTNLLYMRAFAETWPDKSIVQQVVGRIPWGHNVRLLDLNGDMNGENDSDRNAPDLLIFQC